MKINLLILKIYLGTIIFVLFFDNSSIGQINPSQFKNTTFIAGNEKDGPTVSLLYNDTLSLPSYFEFTLPVIMKTGHSVSAISLGLYYPQEYLEITGMDLADSAQGFSYSTVDGLFLLSWSEVNPINIADNDTLLTISMKSQDLSGLAGTIQLGIYNPSEFADESANVIEAVILEIAEIGYLKPDTGDSLEGNYISVNPNPFDDFTTINVYLKVESRVRISLFNPGGMKIMQVTDEDYPDGINQIRLNGIDLSKGLYLLNLEIINEGKASSKLIKILSIR